MDNLENLYKEECRELFEVQQAFWATDIETQRNLVIREQSLCGLLNNILLVYSEKYLNKKSPSPEFTTIQKTQKTLSPTSPTSSTSSINKEIFEKQSSPSQRSFQPLSTPNHRLSKIYDPLVMPTINKNKTETATSINSSQPYHMHDYKNDNKNENANDIDKSFNSFDSFDSFDSPGLNGIVPRPPKNYSPTNYVIPPAPPTSPATLKQ